MAGLRINERARALGCGPWLSTRPAEIEDSFGLEQNWQLPAVLVNVAGIFTGLKPFLDIDKRHSTRR